MKIFIFFLFSCVTLNFGNIFAQTPTDCYSTQWGNGGSGNGQFNSTAGIGTDGTYVYVADYGNSRVQKFDILGNYVSQWGTPGSGNGQFNGPNGLTAANGKLYVAESGNDRIQVFDTNGNFLLKFGSSGIGNGQFNTPTGVASDGNGNIYVADGSNNRIQKFDSSGNYLTQWGSSAAAPGTGNGQFNWPVNVAVDPTGQYVYVADDHNQRVQKFDSNGDYLSQWGSPGSGNGQFNEPRGIVVDCAGNVYVSEFSGNRVQVFDSDGNYLTQFGASGTGQLQYPQGISADKAGNIYVGNWTPDYVVKFSLCSGTLSCLSPLIYSGANPPSEGQGFIYPSPVRGNQATLAYFMTASGQMDLKIFNENGELAMDVTDRKTGGVQLTPLDLTRLVSGIYYGLVTLSYDSIKTERLKPLKFAVAR